MTRRVEYLEFERYQFGPAVQRSVRYQALIGEAENHPCALTRPECTILKKEKSSA